MRHQSEFNPGEIMKKTSFVILISAIAAGVAYAGAEAEQAPLAVALPQPSTLFICTAGMAFFRYLTKTIS